MRSKSVYSAGSVWGVSSFQHCPVQRTKRKFLVPPPEGQGSKLHFVFCWGVEWNDLPSPYLRHHTDDLQAPRASIHLVVWSSCHKACVKPAVPGGGGLAAGRCQFMRVGSVDRASFTALWFTQTSKSDDFLGGWFFFLEQEPTGASTSPAAALTFTCDYHSRFSHLLVIVWLPHEEGGVCLYHLGNSTSLACAT